MEQKWSVGKQSPMYAGPRCGSKNRNRNSQDRFFDGWSSLRLNGVLCLVVDSEYHGLAQSFAVAKRTFSMAFPRVASIRLSFSPQKMVKDSHIFWASLFELTLGLFAVSLGYWLGSPPHEHMPKLGEGARLLQGFGWGVLLGGAMTGAVLFLEKLNYDWLKKASEMGERHLKDLLAGAGLLHIIALSLAAGVGEELLFRGWLQGWLENLFQDWGTTGSLIAIGIAAFFFGLAHPLSKGYIALATLLGFALGLSFYWSRNLFVPIIAHAAYDTFLMIHFKSQQAQRT